MIYLEKHGNNCAPIGMFGWRSVWENKGILAGILLNSELKNSGNSHPLLSNSLFNGSIKTLQELQIKLEAIVQTVGFN